MTGLSVYRAMVKLYPAELRRDFGPEMMEVFADDLSDAYQTRGITGACRVWWCALGEVFRIAMPELSRSPAIVVPAISFLLNVVVVSGELMLGARPGGHIGPPVALTSAACGLTALAVVLTGKVRVIALQLK